MKGWQCFVMDSSTQLIIYNILFIIFADQKAALK